VLTLDCDYGEELAKIASRPSKDDGGVAKVHAAPLRRIGARVYAWDRTAHAHVSCAPASDMQTPFPLRRVLLWALSQGAPGTAAREADATTPRMPLQPLPEGLGRPRPWCWDPHAPCAPQSKKSNHGDISKLLNRLLGVPLKLQNAIFAFLTALQDAQVTQ